MTLPLHKFVISKEKKTFLGT